MYNSKVFEYPAKCEIVFSDPKIISMWHDSFKSVQFVRIGNDLCLKMSDYIFVFLSNKYKQGCPKCIYFWWKSVPSTR